MKKGKEMKEFETPVMELFYLPTDVSTINKISNADAAETDPDNNVGWGT